MSSKRSLGMSAFEGLPGLEEDYEGDENEDWRTTAIGYGESAERIRDEDISVPSPPVRISLKQQPDELKKSVPVPDVNNLPNACVWQSDFPDLICAVLEKCDGFLDDMRRNVASLSDSSKQVEDFTHYLTWAQQAAQNSPALKDLAPLRVRMHTLQQQSNRSATDTQPIDVKSRMSNRARGAKAVESTQSATFAKKLAQDLSSATKESLATLSQLDPTTVVNKTAKNSAKKRKT